ncbi:hypothetical protein IG631_19319 [Alternaria alternata]|nr:hypothetical protein IG631_19319 [Alternaria alternata]
MPTASAWPAANPTSALCQSRAVPKRIGPRPCLPNPCAAPWSCFPRTGSNRATWDDGTATDMPVLDAACPWGATARVPRMATLDPNAGHKYTLECAGALHRQPRLSAGNADRSSLLRGAAVRSRPRGSRRGSC